MKKLIIIPFLLLFINIINAQSTVGSVTYDKVKPDAIVNEFPFEENTTETAVKAKLKALGYTSKSSKGFDVYRGVKLTELGPDTYDLYFKVDRKSKKDKDKSILYLLISKGYDNFITEAGDPTLFANAKTFVNNLVADAAATDLENQIKEQEEVVKKAERRYNSSVDDGNNLEKRKRQIEEDIQNNIKDQATKKGEQASQQQILETLKAKRKN